MNNFLENVTKVTKLMKNFSNKEKIIILCFLGEEEKNVSEIINHTGISQSQISQYLGKMKLEGILESKKLGKEVFYKISDTKILEIIKFLKIIFNK